MIDNIVIEVLDEEHGKKVIEYFRCLGVEDSTFYIGHACKSKNYSSRFYGVVNGSFSNYNKNQIREAKVIELPETLTFPRVVEVFLENNWHKKMALCSTDEGVTCCAFNYDEHENLSEHRIIATWKIWREIKELSTLEQTIAEIDAEYQGRKFQIFHGKDWLQVGTERPDTNTSEMGLGKGGKTIIPENATPNQIVKIVYGLILAYVKHEASEGFKWKGKRVFNPHLKVDALYDIIIDENLE